MKLRNGRRNNGQLMHGPIIDIYIEMGSDFTVELAPAVVEGEHSGHNMVRILRRHGPGSGVQHEPHQLHGAPHEEAVPGPFHALPSKVPLKPPRPQPQRLRRRPRPVARARRRCADEQHGDPRPHG